MTDSVDLGNDLLVGAGAIARFLKLNERQVYHCAEQGSLPVHKQPGLGLVARKSALRAHFEKLDDAFARKVDRIPGDS